MKEFLLLLDLVPVGGIVYVDRGLPKPDPDSSIAAWNCSVQVLRVEADHFSARQFKADQVPVIVFALKADSTQVEDVSGRFGVACIAVPVYAVIIISKVYLGASGKWVYMLQESPKAIVGVRLHILACGVVRLCL